MALGFGHHFFRVWRRLNPLLTLERNRIHHSLVRNMYTTPTPIKIKTSLEIAETSWGCYTQIQAPWELV